MLTQEQIFWYLGLSNIPIESIIAPAGRLEAAYIKVYQTMARVDVAAQPLLLEHLRRLTTRIKAHLEIIEAKDGALATGAEHAPLMAAAWAELYGLVAGGLADPDCHLAQLMFETPGLRPDLDCSITLPAMAMEQYSAGWQEVAPLAEYLSANYPGGSLPFETAINLVAAIHLSASSYAARRSLAAGSPPTP